MMIRQQNRDRGPVEGAPSLQPTRPSPLCSRRSKPRPKGAMLPYSRRPGDEPVQLPPDDDAVLRMLRRPPPPFTPADVVREMCNRGREALVRRAVEEGAVQLDRQPPVVNTVAARGSTSLLRYMISERGVDPNRADGRQITPLLAALSGPTDRNALYLINEAGADVNAKWVEEDATVLMVAAGRGYVEVLKALVAKGADVDAMTRPGMTAVGYAVSHKKAEAALYLLEEAGAAWDRPKPAYLLAMAGQAGLFEFISPLLQHMRSKGVSDGDTAQFLADAAYAAIDAGVSVTFLEGFAAQGLDLQAARVAVAGQAIPLFHAACQYARSEMAVFLLEQGCDPKKSDEFGSLPHHVAAANGHVRMIQWLQTVAPIDVNAPTTKEPFCTMLHLAALSGHMAVVKWLVGQAADVRLLCNVTPPERASGMAAGVGHTAVAAYLREQEAAADARDRAEQAAAEAAVRRARNERRRQKLKKARARRRAADGSDAEGEEEGEEEQKVAAAMAGKSGGDAGAEAAVGVEERKPSAAAVSADAEGEEEERKEEQEVATAMAGLSAGDTAAAGAGEMVAEAAVEERQAAAAAAATATAAAEVATPAAMDPEEDAMLEAAAVSLSAAARPPPTLEEYLEAEAPDGLLCPISMALLDDPVVLMADGITYSRAAIEHHFAFCRQRGKPLSSPSTNMEITNLALAMLAPNVMARGLVLEFKAAKEKEWAEAERRWREATAGKGAKSMRAE